MAEPVVKELTPSDFAKDYPSFNPTIAYDGKTLPGAGDEERRLASLLTQLHENMELSGYVRALVFNMHPFPLKVNGVHHEDLLVPACPPDTPNKYVVYGINFYKVDVADKGDGVFIPTAVPPLALAADFEREFINSEMGGVFFIPDIHGTTDVKKLWDKKVRRPEGKQMVERTVGEIFTAARDKMISFARRKVAEANNEWNNPNGNRRIISQWHKQAAAVLVREGELATLPEWVSMTKTEANLQDCPMCKAHIKIGVVLCHQCGYVFEPAVAFAGGMIGPEHNALRRLSPDVLLELGLDPADYGKRVAAPAEPVKQTAAEKKAAKEAKAGSTT